MQIHRVAFAAVVALGLAAGAALAQETNEQKPFEPRVGQPGRDVVWVPTPSELVETMLDLAKVTPDDFVMDLGSGDGRMIIAAAKRGARALGVEYNEKMVELSNRLAEKEGVAGKAQFVQGDMYEADLSEATVLALFLLTENLDKLAPKFLAMKPGTRIVLNGFRPSGWQEDEIARAEGGCGAWCTAYLHIVPAQVKGAWRIGDGELVLEQTFQMVSGTLTEGGNSKDVKGRLLGDSITLKVDGGVEDGGVEYVGVVSGQEMAGETKGGGSGQWRALKK